MARVASILAVTPVSTAGSAAARYVPLMVLTRVLAFVRFLLVAWLLGDAGLAEYGRYQLSLEIINFGVPVILLGLADVAERYASRFERTGELSAFLARQLRRLGIAWVIVVIAAAAGAPLLGRLAYGEAAGHHHATLIVLAAVNMGVLALYQWVAATLRGVRAYAAAAGLESLAAVLLVALSCLATVRGSAAWLLVAYALSNAIPLAWYAAAMRRYARAAAPAPTPLDPAHLPRLGRFAAWSVARLVLMMAFGLVSIGSVKWLSRDDAMVAAAEYALPYRIGQLLQYVAVMLWASSYGIAASAWAYGGRKRAVVTLLRTGKLGGVLILIGALAALLCIGLFQALVRPAYRGPLEEFLPVMLAMFTWFGMLAFFSVLGDLQERPWRGAALWAIAVLIQCVMLLILRDAPALRAPNAALLASCTGVGVAAVIMAPALFWRPARLTATAVPIGLVLLAPLGLLSPQYVRIFGSVSILAVVGFLWATGLLVRPRDRRALRRQARRRAPRTAPAAPLDAAPPL